MSRIRSRNTRPERILRRALRRRGIHYRSYQRVDGVTVDLVLPDLHAVVFVHGCFWHGCSRHYVPPANNSAFWSRKLEKNLTRDERQTRRIRNAGWRALTVWEHSLETQKDADRIASRILLSSRRAR
jgi:DNA mismatch endonuclease, patch repair protein